MEPFIQRSHVEFYFFIFFNKILDNFLSLCEGKLKCRELSDFLDCTVSLSDDEDQNQDFLAI